MKIGEANDQLRVLIANERLDRLELLARVVEGLGHTVVERSINVNEVTVATARLQPDRSAVARLWTTPSWSSGARR